MDNQKQKITAAIAGVMAYLQEEEAAAQAALARQAAARRVPAPEGFVKPWPLSGRQAMMQVRNLMQLRTFTRF